MRLLSFVLLSCIAAGATARPLPFDGPQGIGSAQSVVVADLNRDGRDDLVVIEAGGSELVWLQNTPSGWVRHSIDAGSPFAAVAVADIDRDGALDLVVSQPGVNTVRWLRNVDGDGLNWLSTFISASATGVTGLAVADIDRDGLPDVVAAVTGAAELRFWRQASANLWQSRLIDSGLSGVSEVAAGDINGDGRIDVVALLPASGQIRWWLNPPNPATAANWAIRFIGNAADPAGLALVDFNRDGALDVLAGSRSSGAIALWLNDGSGLGGTWQRNALANLPGPRALQAVDLDRDGDLDVVIAADGGGPGLAWLENRGTQGFSRRVVAGAAASTALAVLDIERDGDVDLLAVAGGQLQAFRNAAPRRSARFDPLRWGEINFQFASPPGSLANAQILLGDVDGDGRTDAIQLINRSTGQQSPPAVAITRPDGVEAFNPGLYEGLLVEGAGVPPNPALLRSAAVADFDRDGQPELMLALGARDGGLETLAWCRRDPSAPQPPWTCALRYIQIPGTSSSANTALERRLHAADIDRDGHVDLVTQARDMLILGGGNRRLVWLRNRGDMSQTNAFREQLIAMGDLDPVAVVDLTGNGRLDVVARNDIFRNEAEDGTLWTRFTNPLPAGSEILAVGDIDGDGQLDLLAQVPGLGLSRATRSGAQWTAHSLGVAPGCSASLPCSLVDLDGDGDLDVVGARLPNVAPWLWIENRMNEGLPAAEQWHAHEVATTPELGVPGLAYSLDLIDNGLPDLVLRFSGSDHFLGNVGASLLADWSNPAPGALIEGSGAAVLAVELQHGGRSGDRALALGSLAFQVARGPLPAAARLDAAELQALVAQLRVWRDDGDGVPGPGDVLLGSAAVPVADSLRVAFGPIRPDTRLDCCSETTKLWIELVPASGAAAAFPQALYLRGGTFEAVEVVDGLAVSTQPPPQSLSPGLASFGARLQLLPPPPAGQNWLRVRVDGEGAVQSTPAGIACDASGGAACSGLFASTATVTLNATPQPGYQFVGWQGDCSGSGACSLSLQAAREVRARFAHAGPQGSVSVNLLGTGGRITSDPPRIDCPGACSADFNLGSVIRLIATPDPGAEFDRWFPVFCTDPNAPECVFTVQPNQNVTVQFQPAAVPVRTLFVSRSGQGRVLSDIAGIDCGADCQAEFPTNQRVLLSAVPEPGWRFERWTGYCDFSAAANCMVQMNLDHVTTAEFVAEPVLHRLSVEVVGGGRVRSNPEGIDCGPNCSVEFEEGTALTLAVLPDPGFRFAGWSGGGCSGTGMCSLLLAGPTEVQALFEPDLAEIRVQVSVGAGGRVTSQPAGIDCSGPAVCAADFTEGSTLQLIAEPQAGFVFVSWDGDCSGAGACSFIVDAQREVEAVFAADGTTLFANGFE